MGVVGVVHQVVGGVYRVRLDDGRVVEASIRGRLKHTSDPEDRVVIGDRVRLAESEDALTIEERLERTTRLIRAGAGLRAPKVMAANLDRLVVVVAAARPDPRTDVVDRMLALGELGGLKGVVVINKVDLHGTEDTVAGLRALYESVGYPVLVASAESGVGVDDLRALLCTGSSVLVGPSGVGKSTLIRQVQPGLDIRIGEVSERTGGGRHTTVSSRIIALDCGGLVADTPGFGEAGLWGIEPSAIDSLFPEMQPYLGSCQFRECTHVHEPRCAVKQALEIGELDARRYRSYVDLYEGAAAS